MSKAQALLACIALIACANEPPKPARPARWSSLSSKQCVELCAPLPVAHFTPRCVQKEGDSYYRCPGNDYVGMDDICSCGSVRPAPAPDSKPDLVTPVIVHHGLKALSGK